MIQEADKIKMVLMKWDVTTSGVPRIDKTETDAPDGSYTFRMDMFDYRNISTEDYVMLGWESQLPVTVKDGNINKIEALKSAGHLVALCGYPGRKLRSITWKPETNTFNIAVSS
jgi:hypothetical protein